MLLRSTEDTFLYFSSHRRCGNSVQSQAICQFPAF
jgi:hypothetical protein